MHRAWRKITSLGIMKLCWHQGDLIFRKLLHRPKRTAKYCSVSVSNRYRADYLLNSLLPCPSFQFWLIPICFMFSWWKVTELIMEDSGEKKEFTSQNFTESRKKLEICVKTCFCHRQMAWWPNAKFQFIQDHAHLQRQCSKI